MASDSIGPKRKLSEFWSALGAFLKYLYNAILCTGRTNYLNIPIPWQGNHFFWKLISPMKANLRNPQNKLPAKFKHFTILRFVNFALRERTLTNSKQFSQVLPIQICTFENLHKFCSQHWLVQMHAPFCLKCDDSNWPLWFAISRVRDWLVNGFSSVFSNKE